MTPHSYVSVTLRKRGSGVNVERAKFRSTPSLRPEGDHNSPGASQPPHPQSRTRDTPATGPVSVANPGRAAPQPRHRPTSTDTDIGRVASSGPTVREPRHATTATTDVRHVANPGRAAPQPRHCPTSANTEPAQSVSRIPGPRPHNRDTRGRPTGAARGSWSAVGSQSERTMMASPWPPPPHSAAAPTPPPRRRNSCNTVSASRLPLMPIG